MLFPDVALTNSQAQSFCQERFGAGAGLASAAPAVMAAAQALVQQAKVRGRSMNMIMGICQVEASELPVNTSW